MTNVALSLDDIDLAVEWDSDSSLIPQSWIWLMFSSDEEPWFKLTIEEAFQLRDALTEQLRAGGEMLW